MGQHAVVVHCGVTEIGAHPIDTMLTNGSYQAICREIQGLSPVDLHMLITATLAAHAFDRFAQAIWIHMNILKSHCFWADVTAAKRIIGIPLDGEDLVPRCFDD